MSDLLQTIKETVAKENGYFEWSNLFGANKEIMNEVCKRYAFEVAKESLKEAGEKAEYVIDYTTYGTTTRIMKESIANESNIKL